MTRVRSLCLASADTYLGFFDTADTSRLESLTIRGDAAHRHTHAGIIPNPGFLGNGMRQLRTLDIKTAAFPWGADVPWVMLENLSVNHCHNDPTVPEVLSTRARLPRLKVFKIRSLSLNTTVGLPANSIALPDLRHIEVVGRARAIGLLFTHLNISCCMHMAVNMAVHWPRLDKEAERRVISCMADWLQLGTKPLRTVHLRHESLFVGHVTGSDQDGVEDMSHLALAVEYEQPRISLTMLCEVLQLSDVRTLRISGHLLRSPSHGTMTCHPFEIMRNVETLCLCNVPRQRVTELLGAIRTEPHAPHTYLFPKLRHLELCEIDLGGALHELCDTLQRRLEAGIGLAQMPLRLCANIGQREVEQLTLVVDAVVWDGVVEVRELKAKR